MTNSPRTAKSDADWKAELSPEQYRITRQHGTERAFTGPYLNEKSDGTYTCACCGAALFDSDAKYDSGSGWPSFYDKAGAVSEHEDRSLLMRRTEVRCAQCEAHLGHLFEDGPRPTGLRYCINGHALKLEKR